MPWLIFEHYLFIISSLPKSCNLCYVKILLLFMCILNFVMGSSTVSFIFRKNSKCSRSDLKWEINDDCFLVFYYTKLTCNLIIFLFGVKTTFVPYVVPNNLSLHGIHGICTIFVVPYIVLTNLSVQDVYEKVYYFCCTIWCM